MSTEHEELELSARVRAQAALGETLELGAEHLARRGDDRPAVGPLQVGEAHRGRRLPWDETERVEVGAHREVPVPALPRCHLIAVDRVHVDVDGKQVVAPLGAVLRDFFQEVLGGETLALQPPLHVAHGEQHGVDVASMDVLAKVLEGQSGFGHGVKV